MIAAANPKHGRFNPYEPVTEQFVFGSAMLSRFDLIFTFRDEPDAAEDGEIAAHIADTQRAAKLAMRDDADLDKETAAQIKPPVGPDLLRKWLALASRSPALTADPDTLADARETFVALRGANGYDPDDPVPVTGRSWEAILRIAEAAAKLEFSEQIEERHFEIATDLAGQSMQNIGKNKDDTLDADVVETGKSKPQRNRKQTLEKLIRGLTDDGDAVAIQTLIDEAAEHGIDEQTVNAELEQFKRKGEIVEPTPGQTVRWVRS